MKKLISLILAFTLIFVFAVPVFAAEKTENINAEIIYYYNILYVETDKNSGKTAEISELLLKSGYADKTVITDLYRGGYYGDDREFIRVNVSCPYTENCEKLTAYAEKLSGVKAVYKVADGCEENGIGTFSLEAMLVAVNMDLCEDIEMALDEIRNTENVFHAEIISGEFDGNIQVIAVYVELPGYENYFDVLKTIKEKTYVSDINYDWYAAAHESGEYPYGDVNTDKKITAADARKILRISVSLDITESYVERLLADIDCDGKITAADARLTLRTAVGLESVNYYKYSAPGYSGLISGKSIGLTVKDGNLIITASTMCCTDVTKCGFNYIKVQKLVNGKWTDISEYSFEDIYNNSSSKVFSKALSVSEKGTYRAVCEHYAEKTVIKFFTQSAVCYNTSLAVEM